MLMLKILVIDERQERAVELCSGLVMAGHQVAAVLSSCGDLGAEVARIRPDVILIETDAPSRDTLEHIASVDREAPRPVVMLARDAETASIRQAIKAGVAAYVADGIDLGRLKPVIDVAVARFEAHQALRDELSAANQALADRKWIDRAKGILMKSRQLDEEGAFAALRKLAMDRKQPLALAARDVVEMAKLLL